MKKINLKNILKKTFKKKSILKPKKKILSKQKKVATKKSNSPKTPKKIKKSIKTKIKTSTKTLKKKILEKQDNKSENLRISKNNELKPEIKKVKKQESQKKEYKVKDYVVYPKHGVCKIVDFKKFKFSDIEFESYVLKYDNDKATGYCPVNKQSHLRPLATINQVNKCISILKSKPKIKRSMCSRRAQEYETKISSGKIYELAEVVRDLNKGDDLMVDQSYSERQLFEKAYERILSEFQIVLDVSLEDTQKKLDKALKRNLEGQAKAPTNPSSTTKVASTDIVDEEPAVENEDQVTG